MLAKSRTLSETIRIRFDSSSRTKMNAAIAPVTPQDERLQLAADALCADALDV